MSNCHQHNSGQRIYLFLLWPSNLACVFSYKSPLIIVITQNHGLRLQEVIHFLYVKYDRMIMWFAEKTHFKSYRAGSHFPAVRWNELFSHLFSPTRIVVKRKYKKSNHFNSKKVQNWWRHQNIFIFGRYLSLRLSEIIHLKIMYIAYDKVTPYPHQIPFFISNMYFSDKP